MRLLPILAESLLQLSILLPFAWLARRSSPRNNDVYVYLFIVLFLLDSVLIRLLNIRLFDGQQWNWGGKTASLLWALAFLYTTRIITKREAGFTPSVQQRQSVITIMAVLLLLRFALRLLFQGTGGGYRLETFLYEATLPGLSEEIVFRGILLSLLNRVFTRNLTWLNTRFGWGLILTSLLFGAVHGLSINPSRIPDFNSQRFLMTGALGFVMGLLKEKSQSLLPSIVFHNLWNLLAYWGR